MLECAGHAVDLGGAGADSLGGVAPCRRHGRDLFDDRPGLRQCQREIPRSLLQKIERTGALVEVDIRREHARLEICWRRIEIIGRREPPSGLAEPKETVIAQVIVDIGNQHIEDHAPIEGVRVLLSLCAMFCEGVDHLGVAAALAVPGAHHGHGGEERDTDRAVAVEPL